MKKVLKVLGWVLLGVVGLALVLGAGAMVFARRFFVFGRGMMNFPGRMHDGFGFRDGMRGFPMMQPGVGFGMSFLGWLIPFGLFVLLVLGGIGLYLSLRKSGSSTAPVAVAAGSPAMVEPAAVVETPAPVRTCPNCGKPAQVEWVTCPYCSHSLTESI